MTPVPLSIERAPRAAARPRPPRRTRGAAHWTEGEAWLWLTGGALVLCVLMIFGLLLLVISRGAFQFWPQSLERYELLDGRVVLGEVAVTESFQPPEGALETLPPEAAERLRGVLASADPSAHRSMLRTGNYDLTGDHFTWIEDYLVAGVDAPEWAFVVERLSWGRFYGEPVSFRIDGASVASAPAEILALLREHHGAVRERWKERKQLEDEGLGRVNARLEAERLRLRAAEVVAGPESPALRAVEPEADAAFAELSARIAALDAENARYALVLRTADLVEQEIRLVDIVRAYPANRLSFAAKAGIFASRWWEFLTDEPREANSEGGVFPAIFGTVLMTLVMCVLVVPFGVLAALYLREYAKPGPLVSAVRIAVNNLAGVPSIVFGVFGLGFFCYLIGARLDELFFSAKLPNPTLGKGGLLWASLTLALLTLPVVIVATEEALAAVPNSMREGSYGCGATKWQTIQKIVLPRALPGILTGAILSISRGAGEVAPLMLVGAVKLAPELPLAFELPLLGTERSFMHLGFHIFDLGFQSQNSEAAKPMVFTTTLLLIGIVVILNVSAMWLRGRLRRKFQGGSD